MLAKDIEITDIDPRQYENALEAARSSGRLGFDAGAPALIVFYHENRAVHAVHSKHGPLEKLNFRGPEKLDALAREHGVDRVVCLETGALRRMSADAQTRIRWEQPLWDQLLAARAALKREWGSGVHLYPDPLALVPDIPDLPLQLFRWLLPARVSIAVVAFDGDSVWTSLLFEIDEGEVTRVSTTASLEPLDLAGMGLEQKARAIHRAAAARRPPHTTGLYMERTAFRQLISHPRPVSCLARLVRRKWVAVTPFPNRMRVFLALGKFFKI